MVIAFVAAVPRLWNILSEHIKYAPNLNSFKKRLRSLLFISNLCLPQTFFIFLAIRIYYTKVYILLLIMIFLITCCLFVVAVTSIV